ncbi:MAG: hypothetical protein HQ534_00885 [Armatimonadetes bacterium]|nr:hypothetical protein [Armatimonadota bacterium]
MRKILIILILQFFFLILIAENSENIKNFSPQVQKLDDIIWLPNTTAYDFISAFSYKDNIYFALNGGIGKYNQDSLTVYPYPFYGKLKGSIRSVIQINNELWVAIQQDGISIFDMNINSFIRKLEIENESNFVRPFSSINMKYDKEYNTVWISTSNGLYSFDNNNKEFVNWTQKYIELINDRIYSYTPIIIDKENIWIISNSGSGSLLSYNNTSAKWTVFHDELVECESTDKIYIFNTILTPNFLWLDVRGNKKFGYVVEYDKLKKVWEIYEYSELSDMVDRLINGFPNINIFSHSSMSFPRDHLENYKKYYRYTISNPDDFKEYKEYYLEYNEKLIDDMLVKLDSIETNKIFSLNFTNYDSKTNFTYENQLVFHDDNDYISTKQNYLDEIIEYHYPLAQNKNEVILITNKGLSILNLDNYSILNIEGTDKIRFGHTVNTTFYLEIEKHMYFFFVKFGHDEEYFIFDYDMDSHIFKDITPDFEFSFKQKYFWEFDKLFMLRRQNFEVFMFENDKWIKVKEKNEPKKLIQPLSKELILHDGRKVLIDNSGLKIFPPKHKP